MRKHRLAILQNETGEDHRLWVEACRERPDLVEWEEVDLTRIDWLDRIRKGRFDGLLARPPSLTNRFKQLYDERVEILHQELGLPVYPSLTEIKIYENKKYLAYWLDATDTPHPRTWVFYYEAEALDFLAKATLPIVAKTNIGASGRGVIILKTREEALEYARNTFSGKGAQRSVGPKWNKKGFAGRVFRKLLKPQEFRKKLDSYQQQRSEKQDGYVIFQAFIPHTYEWRCVRIGDSFFAHKKMVKGEMASGHLIKGYDAPSPEMLDFVKAVTDRHGFYSQAVDLFETGPGEYLVNEMQCIFGQSDPYQMLINGEPGRYRHLNGEWVFEAGDFNRLKSFALRLEHFLQILAPEKIETPL